MCASCAMLTSTNEGAALNSSLACSVTAKVSQHTIVNKMQRVTKDNSRFNKMRKDSVSDLQYNLKGKAPVYGLLILEAIQHGNHKIPRKRVAIILVACSSPSI